MTADNKSSKKVKSKNQWRREKAKQKKLIEKQGNGDAKPADALAESKVTEPTPAPETNQESAVSSNKNNVEETAGLIGNFYENDIEVALNDPQFAQFKSILNKFTIEEQNDQEDSQHVFLSDDDEQSYDPEDDNGTSAQNISKMGKKKLRNLHKIPLADLKALAPRPDVVEWYDADAPDPLLLVEIKSQKNVVPVPEHWMSKSEYLSSKRGIKKAPFDLPPFIKATGIMDMRDNTKEDEQTLKQKTRERVQPKMGKLDIDYQKLHDAFFKFQVKPRLFKVGEVYYEGKENEKDYSHYRPGKLSKKLVEALNIPPNAPPPWLLNMQRFGPPPSYPGLKIPGLNAPIPAGAQWGFQPGGYGKPPLDENGTPLYGDPYGLTAPVEKEIRGLPIEKQIWGQPLTDESEEEEEDEEEGEEESNEESRKTENAGYVDEEVAAIADHHEEDVNFELRKTAKDTEEVISDSNRKLFQVLEQKASETGGFMGNQMAYDIPALGASDKTQNKQYEVSIDPDAFNEEGGIAREEINRQYQEEIEREKSGKERFQEDLSDLIASESRKRAVREEEKRANKRRNIRR